MSLASVPSQIDDATHARWDETVLETVNVEPSSPFLAAWLLATIVAVSEGLLDGKYSQNPAALRLLKEHPDLTDKLREAWKAETFREIRSLRILRVAHQEAGQDDFQEDYRCVSICRHRSTGLISLNLLVATSSPVR
jgi:hypothetical protein